MFQSKDLSEEQIETLRQWAAEGDQLADLQRKMKEEFSCNVTYMDMRFVVLDLGLEIQTEEEPEPEKPAEEEGSEDASIAPQAGGTGAVSVSVDQITVAGAMVSGRVTFSDGENGRWMIDPAGRPSLDPDTAGYQPTQADLMAFQGELRKALEGEAGLGL
ncbi:MAG: hypothetical protein ACSHYB_04890 [Roseibacillus sp.]